MALFRERLVLRDGESSLQSNGMAVSEIVSRLEAGVPAGRLVPAAVPAPADLIAALAHSALGDDESLGPSLLKAKPPRPRLLNGLSEPSLAGLFLGAAHRLRLALASGLLQVHDFWDASHEAAQRADDLGEPAFAAYWHGIAHRREPDAGNAAYWFRRVPEHAVYKPLAEAARPLLEAHGDSQLAGRLVPGGAWSSSAMIDLCVEARSGTPQETIARRLQRLEMWLLLEATFSAIAPPRA
jgi:hypothetical protein